ncbi:hypothetical protein N7540_002571 [Penicillium herquei]|nr:hypothetical protein N7540_002571 [Penicillium herquei]
MLIRLDLAIQTLRKLGRTPSKRAVTGPRDLWQAAFDGLDPKHKLWLSQEKDTPLEVIQDVIDETEKKYKEYKKKQLTIRRRDGGEVKIREVAQNILASALNAQEIITAVVAFDPTGHGAEDREILDWLFRSDFSNAQNNAQDHRSPGTGDWFLKSEDYGEWKACSGSIFWLHGVDALYECPEPADRRERSLLLSLLTEFQREHSKKIHILVTGRPEPDIIEKLEGHPALDLEERQGSDISAFVELKVGALDARIAPKKVKTQIIDELLQNEMRRFRWADFQIKRLEECRTKSGILEALRTMPETLEEIYLSVIEKINSRPSDVKFAESLLSWLSFCARPLALEEVAEAAGLEVPEDVIRICTTSLVTFRHSDNEIRLAHFSVKEFLVAVKHTGQWFQLSSLSCHAMIAEYTLQLLLQQTVRLPQKQVYQVKEGLFLLHYAARHWHEHFKASAATLPTPEPRKMADELFRQPTIYQNWRRLYAGIKDSIITAPLSVASGLGLIHIVNGLLEEGADPMKGFPNFPTYQWAEGRDPNQNALWNASWNGHLDIVHLMLTNLKTCMCSDMAVDIFNIVKHHSLSSKTLEDIVDTLSVSGVIYTGAEDQGVQIDEKMVTAVARNETCGLKLMAILLDKFEETRVAVVPVTEKVLEDALKNRGCGFDIMQLLLERRTADVQIYPQMKRIMACPLEADSRTIELLLEARHADIDLDEQFIAEFAQYANDTQIRILLRKLNVDTFLTEGFCWEQFRIRWVLVQCVKFFVDEKTGPH